MSSILFGTSGSYLNVGTDVEWRRVLRHHSTSLWVKTTSQARSCLVSLQNEGFEVFSIDMNMSAHPVAAASNVLLSAAGRKQPAAASASASGASTSNKAPSAGPPSASARRPTATDLDDSRRTVGPSAGLSARMTESIASTAPASGRAEGTGVTCDSEDSLSEDDRDDAIFDAFSHASVYFPQGRTDSAGGGPAADAAGLVSSSEASSSEADDETQSAGSKASAQSQRGAARGKQRSAGIADEERAEMSAAVQRRDERRTQRMLLKARAMSLRASQAHRALAHGRAQDVVEDAMTDAASFYGGESMATSKQTPATAQGPIFPCHVDSERRHPAGGLRVRLQDCQGNILVALCEIPVLADDRWHHLVVTVSPKGIELPNLAAYGMSAGDAQLALAAGDALQVFEAADVGAPCPIASNVRLSNTRVQIAVDGDIITTRHYMRRHDHKEARARLRLLKGRMVEAEQAALRSRAASIVDDASLWTARDVRNPDMLTPRSRQRMLEEAVLQARNAYVVAKAMSKVFVLSSDFLSRGIVSRNLYPAPDIIGARNRQASFPPGSVMAARLLGLEIESSDDDNAFVPGRAAVQEGSYVGRASAGAKEQRLSSLQRLSHYFCGRIADIQVVDNSISGDIDALCHGRAAAAAADNLAGWRSRQGLFLHRIAAEAALTQGSSVSGFTPDYVKRKSQFTLEQLRRRNILTTEERAQAPKPTGLVERLRWWATDAAEGLTVWDRGISGSEFAGEMFLKALGGRVERGSISQQQTVSPSAAAAAAAAAAVAMPAGSEGPAAIASHVQVPKGGLQHGFRVEPLHLHMCHCAWDTADSPQSALVLDSSLGYTARIPAFTRRVLSLFIGRTMQLDVNATHTHQRLLLADASPPSWSSTFRSVTMALAPPDEAPSAAADRRKYALSHSAMQVLDRDGPMEEGTFDALMHSRTTIGQPLHLDPELAFRSLASEDRHPRPGSPRAPLRRISTTTPGTMGPADTPLLTAESNLSSTLIERGFSFSLWLRTETTEPSVVASFPFGCGGPAGHFGTDDVSDLYRALDLQDVHLLLNCDTYPSLALVAGDVAYVSHTNACTGRWTQIEWSFDSARIVALRINGELSTYEVVTLSASRQSMLRYAGGAFGDGHARPAHRSHPHGHPAEPAGPANPFAGAAKKRQGRGSGLFKDGFAFGDGAYRSHSTPPAPSSGGVTWSQQQQQERGAAGPHRSDGTPPPTDSDASSSDDGTSTVAPDDRRGSVGPHAGHSSRHTVHLLKTAVGSSIHHDRDDDAVLGRDAHDALARRDSLISNNSDDAFIDDSVLGEGPAGRPFVEPAAPRVIALPSASSEAFADSVSASVSDVDPSPKAADADHPRMFLPHPIDTANPEAAHGPASPGNTSLSHPPASSSTTQAHRKRRSQSRVAGNLPLAGRRDWGRRNNHRKPLEPGSFRGPFGNGSPDPPAALKQLVNDQRRERYELEALDSRYERSLRKSFDIEPEDRNRGARMAPDSKSSATDATASRARSVDAAARSATHGRSATGVLGRLPAPRSRADRILFDLTALLLHVAAGPLEAAASTSTAAPVTEFGQREERKVLAAAALSLQRHASVDPKILESFPEHAARRSSLSGASMVGHAPTMHETSAPDGSDALSSSHRGSLVTPTWMHSRSFASSPGRRELFQPPAIPLPAALTATARTTPPGPTRTTAEPDPPARAPQYSVSVFSPERLFDDDGNDLEPETVLTPHFSQTQAPQSPQHTWRQQPSRLSGSLSSQASESQRRRSDNSDKRDSTVSDDAESLSFHGLTFAKRFTTGDRSPSLGGTRSGLGATPSFADRMLRSPFGTLSGAPAPPDARAKVPLTSWQSSFAVQEVAEALTSEALESAEALARDTIVLGPRFCGAVRSLKMTFAQALEVVFPLAEGRGRAILSRPPRLLKANGPLVEALLSSPAVVHNPTQRADGPGITQPLALRPYAASLIAGSVQASLPVALTKQASLGDTVETVVPQDIGGQLQALVHSLSSASALSVTQTLSRLPRPDGEAEATDDNDGEDEPPAVLQTAVESSTRAFVAFRLHADPFLASLLLTTRFAVEPLGRACLWDKALLPPSFCAVKPTTAFRLGQIVVPAHLVQLNVIGYKGGAEDDEDEACTDAETAPRDGSTTDDSASESESGGHSSSATSSQRNSMSITPSHSHIAMDSSISAASNSHRHTITGDLKQEPSEASTTETPAAAGEGLSAMQHYARKKKELAAKQQARQERREAELAERERSRQKRALAPQLFAVGIPRGLRRVTNYASINGDIVFRAFVRLVPDAQQNFYGHVATLNGVFVLDVDREAIRVVVRDWFGNAVRPANGGFLSPGAVSGGLEGNPSIFSTEPESGLPSRHSSNLSAYHGNQSLSQTLSRPSGVSALPLATAAMQAKPTDAMSATSSARQSHVSLGNPGAPGAPSAAALASSPYALNPREQVLVVYSCSTLVLEDNRWHFIELSISNPQGGPRSLLSPPYSITSSEGRGEGLTQVVLTVDHVPVQMTGAMIDHRGYRALVKRQQHLRSTQAGLGGTVSPSAEAVEPVGRRGRRVSPSSPSHGRSRGLRVSFQPSASRGSKAQLEDSTDIGSKKLSFSASLASIGSFGGSLVSPKQAARPVSFDARSTGSISSARTGTSHAHAATVQLALPMYAGPRSPMTTIGHSHIKCKHLERKWRELIDYVPPMVGETALFSGMFTHEFYLGGCGWSGGVQNAELRIASERYTWPLTDGAGNKLCRQALVPDPDLAAHIRSLPKAVRKPQLPSRIVEVTAEDPTAERQQAAMVAAKHHTDPNTLMDAAKPLVINSVSAGLATPAVLWKPTRLPMQALSFDGRSTVVSAVNFDEVFQHKDFQKFAVSFWIKESSGRQRTAAKGRGSTPGHGTRQPDATAPRSGCVLSVHDVVFPSLEASLGVYTHTTLDLFSSPKKRESQPFTTLFVLLDSSERALVVESLVDIYDGSWHKVEWIVNDAASNDTVILVNDRAANVTVVAADGPRDFRGTRPSFTVGARNDGDGGVREYFKGEIKNISFKTATKQAAEGLRAGTSGARLGDAAHGLQRRTSITAERALVAKRMSDIVSWPMSEGSGGLLFDDCRSVVGVVQRPHWGLTSFPPQVPLLTSDSTIKFASVADLSRAYFRRGVRIDLTLKTAHTGIGSVFAIQSPSRRMLGGLILNTNGGTSGSLLSPTTGKIPNYAAESTDGSRSRGRRLSDTMATADASRGSCLQPLVSPRHVRGGTDDVGAQSMLHEASITHADFIGGVGMVDTDSEAAAFRARRASESGPAAGNLHEVGTHTFVIQHVTQRFVYNPRDETVHLRRARENSVRRRSNASSSGSNSGRQHTSRAEHIANPFREAGITESSDGNDLQRDETAAFRAARQRSVTFGGGPRALEESRDHDEGSDINELSSLGGSMGSLRFGGSVRESVEAFVPLSKQRERSREGSRTTMVLARGSSRNQSFFGPQLVAMAEKDIDQGAATVFGGHTLPVGSKAAASAPSTAVPQLQLSVPKYPQLAAFSPVEEAHDEAISLATTRHLRAAACLRGFPAHTVTPAVDTADSTVSSSNAPTSNDSLSNSTVGGVRLAADLWGEDDLMQGAMGTLQTVVEEVQFQFRCRELCDENWHQLQIFLPTNPYNAEILIDEIRMPLLVVTRKVIAIVPTDFRETLKDSRKFPLAVMQQTPAESQFAWESIIFGRTSRSKSFRGHLKNISIASFDDASFLYVPLANSTAFSTTMPREVATSNIDWQLTVAPPSCLSFSDQEHVVVPPLSTFRYNCFEIEMRIATANVDSRSCLFEYGSYGSGFVSVQMNEDVTGEHRPYHVHLLVADQAGRELRVDFQSSPSQGSNGRITGPFLFDARWHHLRLVVDSARDNEVFVYIDGVEVDVRFGNCGSPSEFAYADEGGTIGAQVVDLKPLIPFCGQLQHFRVCDPHTDETHVHFEMVSGYGSVLQDASGKRHHGVIQHAQWRTKMTPAQSSLMAASGHADAVQEGQVTILSPEELQARRKGAVPQRSAPTSATVRPALGQNPLLGGTTVSNASKGSEGQHTSVRPPPDAVDLLAPTHKRRIVDLEGSFTSIGPGSRPQSREPSTSVWRTANEDDHRGVTITASRWSNSTLESCHKSAISGETIMPFWPVEEGGWESGAPGPQWITIDLGQPCTIFTVAFELPRSFSTTFELYFSRISLNESYSANRPSVEEGKAVPTMTCVERFHFTASTPRAAHTHFPLPFFNVRWIRIRCAEPVAPSGSVEAQSEMTEVARQLQSRQQKQLYVTLRSLKIIGMRRSFEPQQRETVVSVLRRATLVTSMTSEGRVDSDGGLFEPPTVIVSTEGDGLEVFENALVNVRRELEAEEEALARAAERRAAREGLEQGLPGRRPQSSVSACSASYSRVTTPTGSDGGGSRIFSFAGLRQEPTLAGSISDQRLLALGDTSLSFGSAAGARDVYDPLLLRHRQPHLVWRRPLPGELVPTPQLTTLHAPIARPQLPPIMSTPPPTALLLPSQAQTPPLHPSKRLPPMLAGLLPFRTPPPVRPTPPLVAERRDIMYPRATLGVVPTPLPPVRTAPYNEGCVTTDGALVSQPSFERYIGVSNDAQQQARADEMRLKRRLLRGPTGRRSSLSLPGEGPHTPQGPDAVLDDPVERERRQEERALRLLFYRYDVERTGSVPLRLFWDLFADAGGELTIGGATDDGDTTAIGDVQLVSVAPSMNTSTTTAPDPRLAGPATASASATGSRRNSAAQARYTEALNHWLHRAKDRQLESPRANKKPRVRRADHVPGQERVLRELKDVGVRVPFRMLHPDMDDDELRQRRESMAAVRKGQLGANSSVSELYDDDDRSADQGSILVSFEQFYAVISRMQRY